jgi:crossover junction endodeoxyribonuclease RusA
MRFISERGKLFRAEVKVICFNARCKLFTGRLAIHIEARPPDRRARDLDNIGKAPLDALQHAGVYESDSQIDDLRIVRGPVCEGGELVVTIAELEASNNPNGKASE